MIQIPTNSWMNNPQYLAQIGHFLGGGSIAILVSIFFGYSTILYAMLAIAIISGIKEFWYDANYERDPVQSFGDNFMDFSFYQLGSIVGAALMVLAHHLHRIM